MTFSFLICKMRGLNSSIPFQVWLVKLRTFLCFKEWGVEFAFPPITACHLSSTLPFLASASHIWPLQFLLPPGLRPPEPPSAGRSSQTCVALHGHQGETPVSNPGLGDSLILHSCTLVPASWNYKAAETPLVISSNSFTPREPSASESTPPPNASG